MNSKKPKVLAALLCTAAAAACAPFEHGHGTSTDPVSDGERDGSWEPRDDDDEADSGVGCASADGAMNDASGAPADGSDVDAAESDASAPDASEPDASAPQCSFRPYADGLWGAPMSDISFDTRKPGVVYAPTGRTLYRSTDGGTTFRAHGRLPVGGFLRIQLGSEGEDSLLATTTQGFARSEDGGVTWQVISFDGVNLGAITTAAKTPLRIYTSVYFSDVFRSDDGGSTWQATGRGLPYSNVSEITVHSEDSEDAVASLELPDQRGAVVRTTNGGMTWEVVLQLPLWSATVVRCPVDPEVVIAASLGHVARSDDAGATWRMLPVSDEQVGSIAFSADSCDDFYVAVYRRGVHHTVDGGLTFGPAAYAGLELAPIEGKIVVDPRDADHVLLASHNGVYESDDEGRTFHLSSGVFDMVPFNVSAAASDPSRLWLATWGQGAWKRASPQASWQRVPVSILPTDHITHVDADPYVPGRVLLGTNGTLYRSTDHGQTFETLPLTANNVLGIGFHPHDPATFYVIAQNGLFKTNDGGDTIVPRSNGIQPWPTLHGNFIDIRSIAIDPVQPETVYVGTNGGGLYKTENGGGNWSKVLETEQWVGCLLIAPEDPNTLYACVNGVQVSHDRGRTWQAYNDGLSTLRVTQLLAAPENGKRIALTANGVFLAHGSGAWQPFDASCSFGASTGAITTENGKSTLVVNTNNGIYARAL